MHYLFFETIKTFFGQASNDNLLGPGHYLALGKYQLLLFTGKNYLFNSIMNMKTKLLPISGIILAQNIMRKKFWKLHFAMRFSSYSANLNETFSRN